ncbi:hypothetical protein AB0K52_22240 [Glycomyces sp. NPDC049804]|uniref:hypothetical protein n=1 Tax=Glycomyces sp. NPDC049804 TaxID=3154363 RepID=UPI003422C171
MTEREVWFVDGPLKGQSHMIPANKPFWTVRHVPPEHADLLGNPEYRPSLYEKFTYRIQQREDGLWIGRLEA